MRGQAGAQLIGHAIHGVGIAAWRFGTIRTHLPQLDGDGIRKSAIEGNTEPVL